MFYRATRNPGWRGATVIAESEDLDEVHAAITRERILGLAWDSDGVKPCAHCGKDPRPGTPESRLPEYSIVRVYGKNEGQEPDMEHLIKPWEEDASDG